MDSTNSRKHSEDEVLFIFCDVEDNRKYNQENIYAPNKILYRRDLPNMQLIHNIIGLIRQFYKLNIDDHEIHRNIVSRLNYDVKDIFSYLDFPEKSKSKIILNNLICRFIMDRRR
jgi:hypothetical protein